MVTIITNITLKQAPKAGGCATGDGEDEGDRGHRAELVNTVDSTVLRLSIEFNEAFFRFAI